MPVSRFIHGSTRLGAVTIDAYNAELRDPEGFIGDRASKRAFAALFDEWRGRLRDVGGDPLGEQPTGDAVKDVDKLLVRGDPDAGGLVLSVLEEFAGELAGIIRRFLQLPEWHGTQRIVVGGGLRASRVGELAIARAGLMLRIVGNTVQLHPIRHDPDEAGLIGAAQLVPAAMAVEHDSMLAADIGGTNMRTGLVGFGPREAPSGSGAQVLEAEQWRHGDEAPSRDEAVDRLCRMFRGLAEEATRNGRRLAPFIGIGCPGVIEPNGIISRGGQNLPGNWEGEFDLPGRVRACLPEIDGAETAVVLHNDAVLQGLSEAPFQADVARWGVLTIGTGLGNARFTTRQTSGDYWSG